MLIAQVIGEIVSTQKHESHQARRCSFNRWSWMDPTEAIQ